MTELKQTILKCYGKTHVFSVKRAGRILTIYEVCQISNMFPRLSLAEAAHLIKQNIFVELNCMNPTCSNEVHRIFDKNRQNERNGFKIYCSHQCAAKSPNRVEKVKTTKLGKYGYIGFEGKEFAKRAQKTMIERYGVQHYTIAPDFAEKTKKTLLRKWGVEKSMSSEELRQLHMNSMLTKYGVPNALIGRSPFKYKAKHTTKTKYGNEQIMVTSYIRTLREQQGKWIPLNLKTEFERYKMLVWKVTRNTLVTHNVPNIKLRGRCDLKPNAHHLDHKYSIFSGFLNNVDPMIIGSLFNLEVIPYKINSSKRANNSIALKRLLKLYEQNKFVVTK